VHVTYPVDVSSLAVVWCKPKHLLEVLESLLHVVLVVEAESTDVHGVGTHAVDTQKGAENSITQYYSFMQCSSGIHAGVYLATP